MPLIGQKAPDFKMLTTKNLEKLDHTVTLEDYKGKWLVLFFYPLDFTFVCPTEITAISDRAQEFFDLDAEILGVSVDSVYTHRAWINTPRDKNGLGELAYPLASDITKEVARAYDVLVEEEGTALRCAGSSSSIRKGSSNIKWFTTMTSVAVWTKRCGCWKLSRPAVSALRTGSPARKRSK